MRFGKKLALQVTDDQSGAPYVSHKLIKEAINKTVRELRLYQTNLSLLEWIQEGGCASEALNGEAPPTPAMISDLEARVSALDRQLFDIVDEDLGRILAHIRALEGDLERSIAEFQWKGVDLGLLVQEPQLQALERLVPRRAGGRGELCRGLADLRMRSDHEGVARLLGSLCEEHAELVDAVNRHTQYLEINVAGFRKLLKRHEKQVPRMFHARNTPFIEFHRLVTRNSQQCIELVGQLGQVLEYACARLGEIADRERLEGAVAYQHVWNSRQRSELKGLGAECQMVLQIKRQLKDPTNSQILQLAASADGAASGMLYPKPGAGGSLPVYAKPNAVGPHVGQQVDLSVR